MVQGVSHRREQGEEGLRPITSVAVSEANEWTASCSLFAQVIPVLLLAGLLDPRANRGWPDARVARQKSLLMLGIGTFGEVSALIGATPGAVRPLTDGPDSAAWASLAGVAFQAVIAMLALFGFREMDLILGEEADDLEPQS
jgi:hypothetical protein